MKKHAEVDFCNFEKTACSAVYAKARLNKTTLVSFWSEFDFLKIDEY